MPFVRLLCLLLIFFSPVIALAEKAPDPLAGVWKIRIDIPEWSLHSVRTELKIARTGGNGYRGHSRRGAVRQILGFWRGLIGAVLSRDLRSGTWLTFEAGPAAPGHLFDASLRSAFTGPLDLRCTAQVGAFACAIERKGAAFGTLQAERGKTALPIQDYRALSAQIDATLDRHHYRPDTLDDPTWRRARSRLASLLSRAQDDLDALAAWQQVAPKLPDSHVRLLRANVASPSALNDEDTGIALSWDGQVAVLHIPSFALAPERAAEQLRVAFADIAERNATQLVIDLRGNTGGNLSSMLVAAHLFDQPVAAGYFLTRRWWLDHARAPTPAEAAAQFPLFVEHDVDALRSALATQRGLRGQVTPRAPHFAGAVFVLIDARSASASEPLAALLQQHRRAVLVGERTAGAMLSSEAIDLGNGWQLNVPVADFHAADGTRIEGRGVAPDHASDSTQALALALRLARTGAGTAIARSRP